MAFRIAADAVVVVHFGFIVFVAVGGLLAWRCTRLLWLHVPAVGWAIGIVAAGFLCPLTPLERHLRRLGDEQGYEGGFVDRYIEDVVYPGRFTWLARTLVVVLVVVGWAGLAVRRRRRGPLLGLGEPPGRPA